ncbi:CRAL-TRIO domain-containing protein [Crucibulum laeve]|uniref:Phosphatidylinositol transfer protein SFH5 n=1 Tax=Crucibulum laeve TaxID=68775 RepID=A0A5C3M584_9AGAR|nr:CRAL-TRIO domain-containing protein [Crucibulum laeve]
MSPAQPEPAQAPVAATPAPTAVATTAPVVPSTAPIAAPTEPPAAAPTAAAVTSSTVPPTATETAAAAPSTTAPVAATDKKPSTAAADEKPEPQNPLTERFSEAEWTALKAFRAELPNILAEAYPDKPNAKVTPITLWGVKIDPNVKDARASVVLMKFLRARNLSVRDATDMFVSTLRWRESFNIEAALEEKFPEDIFGQLGHVYGHDKEGRPVVYNLYGANKDLKAVFGDVQRFIRWRVALMERSVALLDFREIDQTIQIHDYEGVSLSSRDANSKSAASEATNIFQSHYPELLYKKFFINVPTLLNWIFWAFKPLISANTLAKMTVVGTGHHALKKVLLPHINASDLPERYGGEAKAF